METRDRENEPYEKIEACNWCLMGLHKKCERLTHAQSFCACDCERGY